MMKTVSYKRLIEVLNYDPANGQFTKISGRKFGEFVGSTDKRGYVSIYIDGIQYRAHRLAWLFVHGFLPEGPLDHINRNRSDNRIENLRLATLSLNGANMAVQPRNLVGMKGVSFKNGRFVASITVNQKYKHLGRFDIADEAAHAYNKAAILHFGEFATLNPVGN